MFVSLPAPSEFALSQLDVGDWNSSFQTSEGLKETPPVSQGAARRSRCCSGRLDTPPLIGVFKLARVKRRSSFPQATAGESNLPV
jgi:hypothetical protein